MNVSIKMIIHTPDKVWFSHGENQVPKFEENDCAHFYENYKLKDQCQERLQMFLRMSENTPVCSL